jgi:hypothetical protein
MKKVEMCRGRVRRRQEPEREEKEKHDGRSNSPDRSVGVSGPLHAHEGTWYSMSPMRLEAG